MVSYLRSSDMRSPKALLVDLIKKPPFIFPFIALAHIAWLLFVASGLRHAPFPGMEWLQLLWMVGYTVCWLGVCDLRKWGGVGYLAITMLNQGLYFFLQNDVQRHLYTSSLWLIDIMFCFFILFFFRRLK